MAQPPTKSQVRDVPVERAFRDLAWVMATIGVGHSQIHLMMKNGKFPQSVKIGAQCVRWDQAEVYRWLDERLAADRTPLPRTPRKLGRPKKSAPPFEKEARPQPVDSSPAKSKRGRPRKQPLPEPVEVSPEEWLKQRNAERKRAKR